MRFPHRHLSVTPTKPMRPRFSDIHPQGQRGNAQCPSWFPGKTTLDQSRSYLPRTSGARSRPNISKVDVAQLGAKSGKGQTEVLAWHVRRAPQGGRCSCRLRYPMKLAGRAVDPRLLGYAINEIGNSFQPCARSRGPDAVGMTARGANWPTMPHPL